MEVLNGNSGGRNSDEMRRAGNRDENLRSDSRGETASGWNIMEVGSKGQCVFWTDPERQNLKSGRICMGIILKVS